MRWPIQSLSILLCLLGLLGTSSCSSKTDCGSCPAGTSCSQELNRNGQKVAVCVKEIKLSDVGGVCMGDHQNCRSQFCYTPGSDKALSYCSKPCESDPDCPKSYTCTRASSDLKICVRGSSTTGPAKGCRCGKDRAPCTKHGHEDCDQDAGYFCLSSSANDPKAVCTKPCKPDDTKSCATGFVCTATSLGQNLCVQPPYPKNGLGGSCVKGGKAQCDEGQFCYGRWPDDPNSFCAKYCNPYQKDDCPKEYVCESPRERDPYLCIPRGQKKVGENCSVRDFLDCQSGICAQADQMTKDPPFCTETCSPTKADCPAGFRCRLFGHLYRYLCTKTGDGGMGTICNKNGAADCQSKLCIQPDPNSINKICTEPCDGTRACPGGFTCDLTRKVCTPATGKKKIGDPCNAPQECIFGTCVTDAQGGRFCTQPCTQNEQCPGGYECRHLEFTQRFCLPKQAGNKKVGETCPNGPGDCQSNNCIADPIKSRSFCTEECDDQKPCTAPYKCTKISDRQSYCTPQDYEVP